MSDPEQLPQVDNDSDDKTMWHRDQVYHFEFVHLLVEDCLYKLPKRNLQFSEFFQGMLGPPSRNPRKEERSVISASEAKSKNEMFESEHRVSVKSDPGECAKSEESTGASQIGLIGEGDSDDNPIVLQGISKEAFDSFLEIVYPSNLNEDIYLSLRRWIMVLDLATLWNFNEVRSYAIKNMALEDIDSVEKTYIANKYNVTEWYEDAYFALAKRVNPLTLVEAQTLGLEFTVKLARVREGRYTLGSPANCGSYHYGHVHGGILPVDDVRLLQIVREVFELK